MAEIADRYPEAVDNKPVRARYQAALKEFRLPYWDYYRPREKKRTTFPGVTGASGTTSFPYDYYMPKIFTTQSITVRRTTDDKLVTLSENPLFRFEFPDKNTGGFDEKDWAGAEGGQVYQRKHTMRYPRSKEDEVGDIAVMNETLNKNRMDNTRQMRDMIVDADMNYESFATSSKTPRNSGDLEALHNIYHVFIGGFVGNTFKGWMSYVPTAAFDPVFWIHHW